MKALPVKLIYGQGYEPCGVEDATHITLNIPGPTGLLTLPVIRSGTRAGTGCWTWNGSTDAPTLKPSVLTQGTYRLTDEEHATVMAGEEIEPRKFRCHSWIICGQAEFLDDCDHDLRNTTVDLLPAATLTKERQP